MCVGNFNFLFFYSMPLNILRLGQTPLLPHPFNSSGAVVGGYYTFGSEKCLSCERATDPATACSPLGPAVNQSRSSKLYFVPKNIIRPSKPALR